jgi:glycine dehydrogenase subunit 2
MYDSISEKYCLNFDMPESIGHTKEFFGNVEVVLRAYSWIMNMGARGLLEVSHTAVINLNYLAKLLMKIPGVVRHYAEGKYRLDQTRFSWEKLKEDTGVGTLDVQNRMVDFGITQHFTSHHPWVVPEPFTPEPCETYSKEDIEYWAAVLEQVSKEAYSKPELVKTAPHNQTIHKAKLEWLDDPEKWAMTWRAYKKKHKK